MLRLIVLLSIFIMLLTSCDEKQETESPDKITKSVSVVPEPSLIKEVFTTKYDEGDNVDSPAIWHGKNGENWLLSTAKEGNVIIVFDAATGEKVTQFGKTGKEAGELRRPNGIAVIDDMAIIVERDNRRIQVFSLPEFNPIGHFGNDVLKKPYGITVDYHNDEYQLYVTDNYETPDEETPPADSLGQRVHMFSFTVDNGKINANHKGAFGDTSGNGILHKVESLLIDRTYNRLLIADEHEEHRNVKIYDVEGNFTGVVIPYKYFLYEPEGIVVWACEADSSGYYIIVDQGKINNTFQIFDRKTLEYIGGFGGEITRNTDGIAITQKSFGGFKYGAFYPVHNDGSLTAISWEDIAKSLDLKNDCN